MTRHSKPARRKTPAKSPANRERPRKVPQAHGGALNYGGVPGNAGGTGRPASAIRELCRGNFGERVSVLDDIAKGQVVQRIEVPLVTVLAHAACPKCASKFEPIEADAVELALINVEGKVSASPGDRIKAIDTLGKYGLDARTQLAVEEVRDRLVRQLAVIRATLSPKLAEDVIGKIREVWTD